MILALSERLNKPCIDALANMETLLLKSIAGEEINDHLAWMHSRYNDDVDVHALKTELLVFKQIFQGKSQPSRWHLKSYGRNNIRHQIVVSKCYDCN